MAEYARKMELEGQAFSTQDFFDTLNSMGNIPMVLGHWEMTGDKSPLATIIND